MSAGLLEAVCRHPDHWRPETLAVALTFKNDRPAGAWVEVLDAIEAALAPILADLPTIVEPSAPGGVR